MQIQQTPVEHRFRSASIHHIHHSDDPNPMANDSGYFNSRHASAFNDESSSIDIPLAEDDEHHYFAPQLNGAHVEDNPTYRKSTPMSEESHYFNPHYVSRTPSSGSSADGSSGGAHSIDAHRPHYYEFRRQQKLIPLAMVDPGIHSRRVSALILPSSPKAQSKSAASRPPAAPALHHQQPGRTPIGRRRFSIIGAGGAKRMAGEEGQYAAPQPQQQPQLNATVGRRGGAQKYFRKTSKLAALGSELSQSASALYSLFTGDDTHHHAHHHHHTSATAATATNPEPSHYEQPVVSVAAAAHPASSYSHNATTAAMSPQRCLDDDECTAAMAAAAADSHYSEGNVGAAATQIAAASIPYHQQQQQPQRMSSKSTISATMRYVMDVTDKANAVSEHTERGIAFLDKYGSFVKERAAIEDDYALKIRNLVKKYSLKKKEEDTGKGFSYVNAFLLILREVESLAAQHEIISDKLKKEICPNIAQRCMDLKNGRKQHLNELNTLNKQLTAQMDNMYSLEKGYANAFREAEKAHMKFFKADQNGDISRNELEKTRQYLNSKIHFCEQAKISYGSALEHANNAKRTHYNEKIPILLDEMRKLDMGRVHETKLLMLQCVDVETGVLKVVQRCYNDMRTAIETIDPLRDTQVVVELNRTGYPHPPDVDFQDLGCPSRILQAHSETNLDAASNGSSATLKRGQLTNGNSNGKSLTRKHSIHQRIFGGASLNGKSNGAPQLGEYGTLPPQQRCRKIEAKLAELTKDLQTKEQSREALVKMLGVYTDNPNFGKTSDVQQQMKQVETEIGPLRAEIDRFERLLADIRHEMNQSFTPVGALPQPPNGATNGNGTPKTAHSASSLQYLHNNRTSYSEDSVSSDGSTVMGVPKRMNGNSNASPVPPPPSVTAFAATVSNIPHIDSAIDTASQSNGSQKNTNSAASSAAGGDYYEADAEHTMLPVVGKCKALYPFEAAATESNSYNGTTISMEAGEELLLLEHDEGDGWTRVRNPRTTAEGFVPSAYIECQWF